MRLIPLAITIVTLLTIGCSTFRGNGREQMPTNTHRYVQFDVNLEWGYITAGGVTEIKGVVKNIRYHEMDGLEIRVAPLDADGKEVYRAVDFIYRLKENESALFSLKVPLLASGSRIRFYYSYTDNDGGGDFIAAGRWRQSFEARVP